MQNPISILPEAGYNDYNVENHIPPQKKLIFHLFDIISYASSYLCSLLFFIIKLFSTDLKNYIKMLWATNLNQDE